jgi:hypothetical protein
MHLVDTITGTVSPLLDLATALRDPSGGDFNFEDVGPSAPPEVQEFGQRMFGGLKYIGLVFGAFSFAWAAIKIMAGKGQRHHLAADGVSQTVWVVAGIGALMSAVSIVSFVASGF